MSEEEKDIALPIKKVADRFKQLRIQSGSSSYENFALDHGIGRMQYWRIENGDNLTLKTFFKILQIHGITPEEFFKDFS